MIENTDTFNIINGLAIFTKICNKTKLIAHQGAIDVILTQSQYTQDELDILVQFDWEELTDFSWRYWLKDNPWVRLAGKYENDPHYDEVLEHIEQYRKDLDEEVGRYYDEEYKIVEELQYND